MGEAKQKRMLDARGALGLVAANRTPLRSVPKAPPAPPLRLLASEAELGAASYLSTFAQSMGHKEYEAQTHAISFTTGVPVKRLFGEVVEVVQAPEGTDLSVHRLINLRRWKPEPASDAAVAAAEAALGPLEAPRSEAMTETSEAPVPAGAPPGEEPPKVC
jgi:hypothetical protein